MSIIPHIEGTPFVRAAETPETDLGNGVLRKVLGHGPDLMICRVWFEKGAVGEIHAHRQCQSTYVERGVFEVQIDGRTQVLRAGDSFYVAPFLDHGAVCLEAGVLLDTFSPARKDFLIEGVDQ